MNTGEPRWGGTAQPQSAEAWVTQPVQGAQEGTAAPANPAWASQQASSYQGFPPNGEPPVYRPQGGGMTATYGQQVVSGSEPVAYPENAGPPVYRPQGGGMTATYGQQVVSGSEPVVHWANTAPPVYRPQGGGMPAAYGQRGVSGSEPVAYPANTGPPVYRPQGGGMTAEQVVSGYGLAAAFTGLHENPNVNMVGAVLAGAGTVFAKHLGDVGEMTEKQMVAEGGPIPFLTKYVPAIGTIHSLFGVNHTFICKKLLCLAYPWLPLVLSLRRPSVRDVWSGSIETEMSTGKYQAARLSIPENACLVETASIADGYLPVMSWTTYLIILGIYTTVSSDYRPGLLMETANNSGLLWLVEGICGKLLAWIILGGGTSVGFLYAACLVGYKYAALSNYYLVKTIAITLGGAEAGKGWIWTAWKIYSAYASGHAAWTMLGAAISLDQKMQGLFDWGFGQQMASRTSSLLWAAAFAVSQGLLTLYFAQ